MRALVLSGGGAKGAYQAGALYNLLGERSIHYDIITGTSVGALNGAFISMFGIGSELDAAEGLKDLWFGIDDSKIYRKWCFGLLGKLPLLWKHSVYCTAPLQKLVRSRLKPGAIRTSGKKLCIGAVSLNTGERRVWTEQDDDIATGVLASSSFPGMFEPIESDGELFTDDGVRETTPVANAIEAGATRIDVIQDFPVGVTGGFASRPTTLRVVERVLAAMSAEIVVGDLKVAELYNAIIRANVEVPGKRVVELNMLRPAEVLLENSLDFDPGLIRTNFAKGYNDAKALSW